MPFRIDIVGRSRDWENEDGKVWIFISRLGTYLLLGTLLESMVRNKTYTVNIPE